ncbi:SRPBCC family protein [Streptomyces sp. NPDC005805]|uniref:SRPBCC family protein n=1 Tax=Streptomyces sp. NPDC005805 TaxID=3157068 RepID=UPI0033D3EA04
MTVFRIGRRTGLEPGECWRRVTDWEAHAAGVPFTRVTVVTEGPAGVGTVFVARSGAEAFGFDDPMEIVRWDPPAGGGPGVCRLEKRGRAVTGWAEIEVRPVPGGGSVVLWVEELSVRGVPALLDPLVTRVGRVVFGRALDGLLSGRR